MDFAGAVNNLGKKKVFNKPEQSVNTEITDLILTFPTPTTLNFTFGREWGSEGTSFFGAFDPNNNTIAGSWENAKSVLRAASAKAWHGLQGSALQAKIQSHSDKAMNNRNVTIFKDLPFRELSLAWILRPRKKEDSVKYFEAIQKLKVKSAPELVSDGNYWDTSRCHFALELRPASSLASDELDGPRLPSDSPVIFKSQNMVITSINVDYTPNSFWSQHKDGYPVQINLSISMVETQLAYRLGDKLVNYESKEVI